MFIIGRSQFTQTEEFTRKDSLKIFNCFNIAFKMGTPYWSTIPYNSGRTQVTNALVKLCGSRDKKHFNINLARKLALEAICMQCKPGRRFYCIVMSRSLAL